jgi:hypothetical protein
MVKTDMPVVLLNPDVNQTACLPCADLTTLTGVAADYTLNVFKSVSSLLAEGNWKISSAKF